MSVGQGDTDDEDVVFVACQQVAAGDPEWVLEMRRDPEGRAGLLVFSSLELLVAGCGEHQPWLAVPVSRVEELGEKAGAEVVLMDVALDPAQRHFAEENEDQRARGV